MKQGEIGTFAANSGAVVLGDAINHLVGTTPKLITPPADQLHRFLVVSAERGNFRIAQGDKVASPPSEFPASSVEDGNGWSLIPEGAAIPFPMPDRNRDPFSLVGFAANSVATYWFA